VAQAEEIGRFNMGSTVVVLLGSTAFTFAAAAEHGAAVRMGQRLGAIASR
jgi:phosphatidylserine decarboxylase